MYPEGLIKEVGSSFNFNSAADVQTFTPTFPCEIVEFGAIVTTAMTTNDNFILKADKRPTAASDTGRGDGDIGTLTIAAADSGGVAAGEQIVSRPASPVTVLPGQQVILEVTGTNADGVGLPFINYRRIPKLDSSTTVNSVTS